MLASDAYETVFCKTCGTIATTIALGEGYACKLCGTKANFGRVTIPYVYKYLTHLLNGMGFFPTFKLATEDEYRDLRDVQRGQAEAIADIDVDELEQEEDPEGEEEEEEGLTQVEHAGQLEFVPEEELYPEGLEAEAEAYGYDYNED